MSPWTSVNKTAIGIAETGTFFAARVRVESASASGALRIISMTSGSNSKFTTSDGAECFARDDFFSTALFHHRLMLADENSDCRIS